jgi:hypothetical protein
MIAPGRRACRDSCLQCAPINTDLSRTLYCFADLSAYKDLYQPLYPRFTTAWKSLLLVAENWDGVHPLRVEAKRENLEYRRVVLVVMRKGKHPCGEQCRRRKHDPVPATLSRCQGISCLRGNAAPPLLRAPGLQQSLTSSLAAFDDLGSGLQ